MCPDLSSGDCHAVCTHADLPHYSDVFPVWLTTHGWAPGSRVLDEHSLALRHKGGELGIPVDTGVGIWVVALIKRQAPTSTGRASLVPNRNQAAPYSVGGSNPLLEAENLVCQP